MANGKGKSKQSGASKKGKGKARANTPSQPGTAGSATLSRSSFSKLPESHILAYALRYKVDHKLPRDQIIENIFGRNDQIPAIPGSQLLHDEELLGEVPGREAVVATKSHDHGMEPQKSTSRRKINASDLSATSSQMSAATYISDDQGTTVTTEGTSVEQLQEQEGVLLTKIRKSLNNIQKNVLATKEYLAVLDEAIQVDGEASPFISGTSAQSASQGARPSNVPSGDIDSDVGTADDQSALATARSLGKRARAPSPEDSEGRFSADELDEEDSPHQGKRKRTSAPSAAPKRPTTGPSAPNGKQSIFGQSSSIFPSIPLFASQAAGPSNHPNASRLASSSSANQFSASYAGSQGHSAATPSYHQTALSEQDEQEAANLLEPTASMDSLAGHMSAPNAANQNPGPILAPVVEVLDDSDNEAPSGNTSHANPANGQGFYNPRPLRRKAPVEHPSCLEILEKQLAAQRRKQEEIRKLQAELARDQAHFERERDIFEERKRMRAETREEGYDLVQRTLRTIQRHDDCIVDQDEVPLSDDDVGEFDDVQQESQYFTKKAEAFRDFLEWHDERRAWKALRRENMRRMKAARESGEEYVPATDGDVQDLVVAEEKRAKEVLTRRRLRRQARKAPMSESGFEWDSEDISDKDDPDVNDADQDGWQTQDWLMPDEKMSYEPKFEPRCVYFKIY